MHQRKAAHAPAAKIPARRHPAQKHVPATNPTPARTNQTVRNINNRILG